jgi:AraC family transcriptional activator FtrA
MSQVFDPGRLCILAYRDLHVFEYAIAVEVFALRRPNLGVDWYSTDVVAAESGRFRGIGGVEIKPTAPFAALAEARTIVVPGWVRMDQRPPPRLLRALVDAHARGARLLSICSGAYVLAAAGLLDGRRATTHWLYSATLRERFPRVRFEDDVLYVDEGNLITSAGSAAGIDACLHLVRRDFGARVANQVARRMVCAPHREGGQAQYVETAIPEPTRAPRGSLERVFRESRQRLSEVRSVADLARRALMSERSFSRHAKAQLGMTPAAWLARERIAKARELLEASALPIDEVGARCGYESPETFRVAFKRIAGVAPGTYRQRFAAM